MLGHEQLGLVCKLLFFPFIGIVHFLTFPACFYIPNIFSNLNSNCSNVLDLRNLQQQVKKAFVSKIVLTFHCLNKLFFLGCRDLKCFANYRPSASNFKRFSRSEEQFLFTVGQNNFGNKIPIVGPALLDQRQS